ncbi:MAG TPA: hypothetical protein VHW00_24615 [Thermoanaerobaculia bacterium]|nr:hypothetical protein [Thermoanaerobaculia bacterium]
MNAPGRARLQPLLYALFAAATAFALALLQWGQQLNWDEIEFFRATKWIAGGQLPFRDYWEHHLPLQWLLFAPVAAMFSNGPGAAAIVALRWAQLPLWLGAFVLLFALMRRCGLSQQARWTSLVCLLSSLWFVRSAIQYRVDVPAHLAYLLAVYLLVTRTTRRMSLAAGALFSAAVLSNMRLAPLVVLTVLLFACWQPREEKWRWNAAALLVIAGGALVAIAFVAYLAITNSLDGFREGVLWYNTTTDRMLPKEASSFLARLGGPLVQRDLGGSALLLLGAIGAALALKNVVRPSLRVLIALLAIASLITIAILGIQYEYHFQTTFLLLVPLAAIAIEQWRRATPLVLLIAAASLGITAVRMLPEFGAALRYQDRVMIEVDRRTNEGDRVWDSTGYALRRAPAYRYWFLAAGVRILADASLIEPYDIEQMIANPPAAIVFNSRTQWWMAGRPRLAAYATHHYVPLYQHLWLPGMSGVVGPRQRVSWIVPRTGRYDVHVSELLTKHPWFSAPSNYGLMSGAELEIPLDRIPPAPRAAFRWFVNGVPVEGPTLDLRKGASLQLVSMHPRPAGVFVVQHGTTKLSRMPDVVLPF